MSTLPLTSLVFQQFSTPKSSSTYLITRPTATRTPSRLSSSSASPTSALTNASVNHSRLNTGAKAGVGVGVAVGVISLLALLAFLVFFFRRRSAATAGKDKALEGRAENGDSTKDIAGPAYEKQGGAGAGVKEVNS